MTFHMVNKCMLDVTKTPSNQQNGHQKTALLQGRVAFVAVLTSRDVILSIYPRRLIMLPSCAARPRAA